MYKYHVQDIVALHGYFSAENVYSLDPGVEDTNFDSSFPYIDSESFSRAKEEFYLEQYRILVQNGLRSC